MAKSIEEKVEEHYKDRLKELGITYYGKTQASQLNESIANALKEAPSKSGGSGNNYPDIMLMLKSRKLNRYIPVMIEAKGGKNKLEKLDKEGNIEQVKLWDSDSKEGAKNPHKKGDPNFNSIEKYAVNGAYHYAKIILEDEHCNYDEVIFIGVNGTKLTKNNEVADPEHKVYYLSKSNKMQPKYVKELNKSWDLMKTDNLESLFDVVDKLTLSDGIVQLKPEKLDGNIDDDNDGTTILKKISSFLKKRNSNNYKVKMIMDLLSPIFTKKVLWENNNGESLIKHIFTDIHSEVIPLLESDLQLDFTGKILNSLNDWVSIENDKQNDVVLTPRYVTKLMVKLTRTDMNSYVWDTAMGSGGFLVSAMDEMFKDAKEKIQDKKS